MTPLYLRYRNSTSDPWTVPPALASSVPGLPAGALPLDTMALATGPATETPCGCASTDPYTDDHYALKAGLTALPQAVMASVATYLLRYKQAAYHEAMHSLFATGGFVSAGLDQLQVKNADGRATIAFRVAAKILDIV
jgi:hypothetical protein